MPKKKKTRTSHVPLIPQLSLSALDAVQKIERYARHELNDCRNTDAFNTQKAKRILRTCTVQVLKTQLTYYEALPTFHDDWIIQLQEDAIESAVGMIPGGYRDNLYEYFRDVLWDTTYADLNPPKKPAIKRDESLKHKSRQHLRDLYLATFPETKILDVCWAAKQTYREWKRWIKNQVKDGSRPDRAFRSVLNSEKPASELRTEARPSGWK
jgi:hypothetical protein